MNHALASGLAGLLTISLGLAVLLKSKESKERKVFAWLCLTVFGWLFSYSVMEASSDYEQALLFARIGHSSVIFVPIAYLHFTRYFLNRPNLTILYRVYYIIGLFFLYLMWSNDQFIPRVIKQSWGFYPIGSPIMLVDALILLACATLCWVIFVVSCRRTKLAADFLQYNRLKYCCLALTIFSFGALDYLPKFGISYYPLSFLTTTLFVSMVSYAILVHRLMDINIVIRKSLIYSVLVGFMTAIYFSFVFIAEKLFQGVVGYRSLVGSLVAGFAIALGFNPLKEFIQRFVDQLFFKGSQITLAEENERLRQELTRSEKLKAVATLAAGMAHEIKNPLSSIKTFAEYLPQKYNDPAFREKFTKIMSQEVDKMNALVQRLLEFARPAQPRLQVVRLSTLVNETLDFLQGTFLEKQVQVETKFDETDEVLADPAQMKQVFLNILLNSIEAMERPGHIRVTTGQEDGRLEVAMADTGPGISKKDLQHVFDPFYTTKPGGTGLGLSVVHSIVREHGGHVTIQSETGRGTIVQITLPLNGGANGSHTHPHRG